MAGFENSRNIKNSAKTKKMDYLPFNTFITAVLTYFTILSVSDNPVQSVSTNFSQMNDELPTSNDYHLQNIKNVSECVTKVYELKDVMLFDNGSLFIKAYNLTVLPESYQSKDDKIFICLPIRNNYKLTCGQKFKYKSHEYHIYPNSTALVRKFLFPKTKYELEGDTLLICAPSAQIAHAGMNLQKIIYVGQVGSGISIIALIIHLMAFVYLPSLRNLHGYNLASLSLAFLLAYSFVLIGQIPQVLGLFCVISGILQQNFFLAAFSCMNVLAFDIWRRLKKATEHLIFEPQHSRQKKFVRYSLYAWGVPLLITSISVIVDNIKGVPNEIKPDYGKDDICRMSRNLSKAIFFTLPAFTLTVVNAVFFVMTVRILVTNKMDCSKDQKRHAAKNNFILYVKLAVMMGLTWLVGVIALISQNDILWFIFDVLNSLQGLIMLLFLTCTKKVVSKIAEKTSVLKISFTKKSTATTSVSTKNESQLKRH